MNKLFKRNPALIVCMVGIVLAWTLTLYLWFSGTVSMPVMYGIAALLIGTGFALVVSFFVFLRRYNKRDKRIRELRQKENAEAEARQHKADEEPQKISDAEAINEELKLPVQTGFKFEDWGKWGIITDEDCLYENPRNELLQALYDDAPFNTGWHGFAKENESMMIVRDEDALHLYVYVFMNDDEDLFANFLTEEELKLLTEDKINQIRARLTLTEFSESVEYRKDLPLKSSYEDILKAASEMAETCHAALGDNYCDCVRATIYTLYGESMESERRVKEIISATYTKEN